MQTAQVAWRPVAFAMAALMAFACWFMVDAQTAEAVAVTRPHTPSFKVVDKGYTSMTLSISVKGAADGFQVSYRDESGVWKKKRTADKSVKLTKMGINHTYQIRVRAFNVANGKRYHGKFCKLKTVFNGVKPLKDSQVKKMWYKPFIHGTKKAGQQRYIMLHDTEGYASPENIVDGWKSDNGGTVAAHFVVGRDGKVVQTAKMRRILHHAGYGGPGNYDKKFGVGKNNGKGNGDDLIGQVQWYGYTSYGMNSYSIGIEMCHVGGQNYPEAQLKAVDRLIAYIDQTYDGYGGKIIDHKTWRPSNSDTDSRFAKYLKNYQKYRKHVK